jgi:hypothetical protein
MNGSVGTEEKDVAQPAWCTQRRDMSGDLLMVPRDVAAPLERCAVIGADLDRGAARMRGQMMLGGGLDLHTVQKSSGGFLEVPQGGC